MTAISTTHPSAAREFGASVATIMVKELRSRMRGRRSFIVLTVYLAILALITYGVYLMVGPSATNMGPLQANASVIVGQSIFTVLSIFQLILICFIAPAFTSGQISLEREKQTLDLLISTPMRPAAIVIGKLAAALAFVVLMIVAALPISAIVLMYGGASVDDLVRQQLVLLATALVLGTVGLFFSALLKRTQAATVLTYITVLGLTLGTVMIYIFWSVVLTHTNQPAGFQPPDRAPEQIMYLNPMVAMLDVVGNAEPGGFGAIHGALTEMRTERPGFGMEPVEEGALEGPVAVELAGYWWPRVALTFVVVSTLLTLAATRMVVPAGMRFAFRRTPRQPATQATPIIEELGEEPKA